MKQRTRKILVGVAWVSLCVGLAALPLILAGCVADTYTDRTRTTWPSGQVAVQERQYSHVRNLITETVSGGGELHFPDGAWARFGGDFKTAVDPNAGAVIGAGGTAAGNVIGAAAKSAVRP